jgi:hypothetical protein
MQDLNSYICQLYLKFLSFNNILKMVKAMLTSFYEKATQNLLRLGHFIYSSFFKLQQF